MALEKDIKRGTEKDFHVRIHAVGHKGAGKTSLMRKLCPAAFTSNDDNECTKGKEIRVDHCYIDMKSWSRNKSQGK